MKAAKYVVDASVILSSLLEQEKGTHKKSEKILKLAELGKVELMSHSLLSLEVANGLRFKGKDSDIIKGLYKTFLELPINIIELTSSQCEETLSISYELGTTVYDTSYHILAKAYGATFLTSDREYFKKAKKLGDIELIS